MTMNMGPQKSGRSLSKTGLSLLAAVVMILIVVGVLVSFPKTANEPKTTVMDEPTPVQVPGHPRPSTRASHLAKPQSKAKSPSPTPPSQGQPSGDQSRNSLPPQAQQQEQPGYTFTPGPTQTCASGSVTFRLNGVEVFRSADFYNKETIARGAIVNETTASVDIDLWGEAAVIGIDSQGVVQDRLYAEVIYTPPVGTKRPLSISLEPGGHLNYEASMGSMPDESIQSWILDPDSTGSYIWYSEEQPTGCSFSAPAVIGSGPVAPGSAIMR